MGISDLYLPLSGSLSWMDRSSDSPIRQLTPDEEYERKQEHERAQERLLRIVARNEEREREWMKLGVPKRIYEEVEREMLAKWAEEREALLAEHERLTREGQEVKERAKEERRAQQLIRTREHQRNYYQKHVKKPVECERCEKMCSSVYSMRRHLLKCTQ